MESERRGREEEEEEERVEDKKGDGREEEDDGGWRFLDMPLWSMKRRKSEMGSERVIEMGVE